MLLNCTELDVDDPAVTALYLFFVLDVASNQTPLHLVAANGASGGHPEIIRALLTSDARVNQPDSGQQTALHKAALTGSRDDVKALLDGGADPNYVDNMGHSPVHVAVKRKTVTAVDEKRSLNHFSSVFPTLIRAFDARLANRQFSVIDFRLLWHSTIQYVGPLNFVVGHCTAKLQCEQSLSRPCTVAVSGADTWGRGERLRLPPRWPLAKKTRRQADQK